MTARGRAFWKPRLPPVTTRRINGLADDEPLPPHDLCNVSPELAERPPDRPALAVE